jgi:hypothetical protein
MEINNGSSLIDRWHKKLPWIIHGTLLLTGLAFLTVIGIHSFKSYAQVGPTITIVTPLDGSTVSGSSVELATIVETGGSVTAVKFR